MRWRCLLLACVVGIAPPARSQAPVTGDPVPGLEAYDAFMQGFLSKWQIPGGAIAVSRNGQLVYARGFGFADRESAEPVRPDALFRIASLSKPITAVAVMKLVEQGRVELDARVFDLLPEYLPNPRPGGFDNRIPTITVRQLLHHIAGWDRNTSGVDPMFQAVEAARRMGEPSPGGCPTIIRATLRSMPLDFAPGARYAYSNFGYCILGRVVERAAGMTYERYVQEEILRPAGIGRMRLGKTSLQDRVPGEVKYYDWPGAVPSILASGPSQVIRPYGEFYLEALDSHGGWLASAVDLVKFADSVDGRRGFGLLSRATVTEMLARPPAPVSQTGGSWYGKGWNVVAVGASGATWWHTGSLPGTISYLAHTDFGVTWAAVFNFRPQSDAAALTDLDNGLSQAFRAVRSWPSHDLHPTFVPSGGRPTLAATLAVTNAASFEPGIVSGSWVRIRGENLAPATRSWQPSDFQDDRLPTSLDGVQALFNGRPAAVSYISDTDLNVQAPDLPAGRIWVQVSRNGDLSEPVPATVRSAAPGLFMRSAGDRLIASAAHPDGAPIGVEPGARPATPGGRILLFATGLAPSPAGRVVDAPVALPEAPDVRIGGLPATVEYAGLVAAGLFQINLVVPDTLPAGDHEVTIQAGGQTSRAGVVLPVAAAGL